MKICVNQVINSSNMRWAGHVTVKSERTYRILVGGGEAEGNRLFGRGRFKWDGGIKMGVQ